MSDLKRVAIYSETIIQSISYGEINREITCPEDQIASQLQAGEMWAEIPEIYYINHPVENFYIQDINQPSFMERANNSTTADKTTVTADGVDAIILSQALVDGTLEILGPVPSSTTIVSTTVALTFTVPGTYTLYVSRYPTRDWTINIEAI